MSRFFLHISRNFPFSAKESALLDFNDVQDTFNEVDAPVWHRCHDEGATLLIGGHDQSIFVEKCSFCTGTLFDSTSPDNFSSQAESGFATLIVSCQEDAIQVSSNLVAGRSVWYYFDDSRFILSSSQRAIVRFLGSFHFNEQAMVWMLATGNLGPGNSWDKRIFHLDANRKLHLDRHKWHLTAADASELDNEAVGDSFPVALASLDSLLNEVFSKVAYNGSRDLLALSGGNDSRLVLNKMNAFHKGLDTVTWGLSSARFEKDTDAFVASAVAKSYGVENLYYETDFQPRDFTKLIDNFLLSGEGRLDHINAFMDGLMMWRNLSSGSYRVIYRADEVFGWLPCSSEKDVRISLDFHYMEDNSNMISLQKFGFPGQKYPPELARKTGETISSWRDRLYRSFRLPVVLTALHDVNSSYMEVFNPLLHDSLIRFCMKLPDGYRTHKKLYSNYMGRISSSIPIARKSSIPEPAAILRSSRFVSFILDEFHFNDCRNLFGDRFLQWIEANLEVDDELINRTNDSFLVWVKSMVPWKLKKILRRDFVQYQSDFNQLAFRVFIISRMKRLFDKDALTKNLKN